MKIGIIGGGALGLAAAYQLGKDGHQAAVFERAAVLGGQASTFDVGGGRLERGYHHLFKSDTHMVDLIHELGLGPKLAWIESKVGFFYGGKIHQFTTPLDLLRFTPLSPYNRVKLGLMTLRLQRTKYWPRELERVTAEEWIRTHAGKQIFDVIWNPMLRGKFGESASQVSMAWLWGKIYLRTTSRDKGLRSRERLGYPLGSFAEIFEALEREIRAMGGEVHYPSTVHRVTVRDGRATGLDVQYPGGGRESRDFDVVLSTTPSSIFPRLVPELPESYTRLLAPQYQAAVLIIMELDRPFSWAYWMNIADRSIPFVGLIEHTNFVDKERYGGKHLVYLSNYLSRASEMYSMPPDELWRRYVPALKKINPAFDESWVTNRHYHREDAAQPIIGVDYSQRIPPLQTPLKDLWLANTTQIYPEDRGTNYSVRLGRLVAKMITGQAPVCMWWE